jgi:acyl-CoA reductase-like NAD-dependent aldehyde dehydrogenase
MAKLLDEQLETLRGAVADGRTRNVRYRQNELHNLHAALRGSRTEITKAIALDSSSFIEVADTEFFLAMDSISQAYNTLNFDQLMKEEYNVKYGKDNLNRVVEFGLVVLRPTTHSRFYSIVTPLAAAIAAGNTVLLEVRTQTT